MRPAMTSLSTYGTKTSTRNKARPRKRRLSSRATPMAIGPWIGSDSADDRRGCANAPEEDRVVERAHVVVESDEPVGAPQPVPPEEAVDREADRQQHERHVDQKRRRGESPIDRARLPRRVEPRARAGGGRARGGTPRARP